MIYKVYETIKKYNLLLRDDRCIVGVSGGADSVALLCLLSNFKKELNIELRAVHVHHGIRGAEADTDYLFVKNLCNQMKVKLITFFYDVPKFAKENKLSEEEAGRTLRYKAFDEAILSWKNEEKLNENKEYKIAVAHNMEDNAETIIMNLARGTGLRGISGISIKRGNIIRPLLFTKRKEIENYLNLNNINYKIDSTNLSDDYTRNVIRHHIIDKLKRNVNPLAVEHISNASRIMEQADSYFLEQADNYLSQNLIENEGFYGVNVEKLSLIPEIIRTYIISGIIKKLLSKMNLGYKDISLRNIEDIDKLIFLATGKKINLPYGLLAKKDYKNLWIGQENAETYLKFTPRNDTIFISEEFLNKLRFYENATTKRIGEFELRVFEYKKELKIPKEKNLKWFDISSINKGLEIRTRKKGDYIRLSTGGKKSVKDYMINTKIDKEQRNHILLITQESHVLWIVGYRTSDFFRVNDKTKMILDVKWLGGD